jgi:hypothetical protein
MDLKSVSKSRWLVWGALVAFGLFVVPLGEVAWAKSTSASLVGFVYAQDMKTPVAGAVVKVRNMANQKEFASSATDANGMYKIDGIDEGRYILGVTATAGNFNFDYVMLLKGGEIAKLSVGLAPGTTAASGDKTGKKNFFATNLGFLAIVAVEGGLFLLVNSSSKAEASPIR